MSIVSYIINSINGETKDNMGKRIEKLAIRIKNIYGQAVEVLENHGFTRKKGVYVQGNIMVKIGVDSVVFYYPPSDFSKVADILEEILS